MAENYLRKGSKVYLEGQLQTRKWHDQQGQDRYSTEVVLQGFSSNLTMLDGRNDNQGGGGGDYGGGGQVGYGGGGGQMGGGAAAGGAAMGAPAPMGGPADDMDDEIPF